MSAPRTLILDIETFPIVAYVWGRYDQNVVDVVHESCVCCFSAKWIGGEHITKALPDYKGYRPGKRWDNEDEMLVRDMWTLLDEADVVVAHNGIDFDVKVVNSRFAKYGLGPPSPYKTVDTLREWKKVMRTSSNKLDDVGAHLSHGRKIKVGFEMWKGCMDGDEASWERMKRYNKRDVTLLEQVYNDLVPWIKGGPNAGLWKDGECCPKCGSENIQRRGESRTATTVFQRVQCLGCGGWSRFTKSEKRALLVAV